MIVRHGGPRAAAVAVAAIVLACAAAQGASAAGEVDGTFSASAASAAFGIGARAASVALASGGRIVVAGDERGSGGEGALTARFTAAGGLDASFAGTGRRIDTFGTGAAPQRAGAVAVQADGATIIAGVAGDDWSLARFDAGGMNDGLFGAAGVTLRDPSPGDGPPEEYPGEESALPDGTGPAAIAITPAGQIVVAGSVAVANDDGVPGEQIVVARFDARGLPDPAFGHDGFSLLQLGFGSAIRHASSAARALTLLPDGRILIAGRATGRDGGDRAFVARLATSGALDTGFARAGRLLVQLGRASAAGISSSSLEALVQRPDGRLLAAGRATDVAGGTQLLLAGFTAGGALDGRFGSHGSRVTQLGRGGASAAPASVARALAPQPDGSVVVAGAANGGLLAARYGPTGALDCGYGVRGRTLAFGAGGFDVGTDGATAAALQPDGKLLLAGRRAGGGLLLTRLDGGPPAAASAVAPVRLVTLGVRYTGRGRGYAYGLVDRGCSPVSVRFAVAPAAGRATKTKVQRVLGRGGPQIVCARLTGLRPGGRYRIRIAASAGGGAHGAVRVLRAVRRSGRKVLEQEGCA